MRGESMTDEQLEVGLNILDFVTTGMSPAHPPGGFCHTQKRKVPSTISNFNSMVPSPLGMQDRRQSMFLGDLIFSSVLLCIIE